MYTNKYDYQCVFGVKIILKNQDGLILLIQEPETNAWMPLHWGLPGGKPTETESLMETIQRKVKTEIGQKVLLKGLFKIEELLIEGRTVLIFIVIAESTNDLVEGEAKTYKWVSKDDLIKMDQKDFTEFFNKDLLINYFDNPIKAFPLELIQTNEYYKMNEDETYASWYKSGKK